MSAWRFCSSMTTVVLVIVAPISVVVEVPTIWGSVMVVVVNLVHISQ